MKLTNDFLDSESKPKKVYDKGFDEELKTLEQISYANQKGIFTK